MELKWSADSQEIERIKQEKFVPPYCPNPKCQYHNGGKHFWVKNGVLKVKKFPGFNQLYKCIDCGRGFCYTAFKLNYRHRSDEGFFQYIFEATTQGHSNRSIARNINLSECSVRNKIKHLARQTLLKWEELSGPLKINEAIAYDGFETFVHSQFDPNNINHAVGVDSLFLYDFNYAHLNRKGKMTTSQKRKLQNIVKSHGRYPTDRIRVSTKEVFTNLMARKNSEMGNIQLYTDEHKAYKIVLKRDIPSDTFEHFTINSKACRDGRNPLFPVNHLDLKLRHFLKSCTRETIAFNKNESGLMDRYILFGGLKNFMCSRLIKGRKHELVYSPAMLVGITDKILNFYEFFDERRTQHQVKLRKSWQMLYKRTLECSRFKTVQFYGH